MQKQSQRYSPEKLGSTPGHDRWLADVEPFREILGSHINDRRAKLDSEPKDDDNEGGKNDEETEEDNFITRYMRK